MAGVLPAAPTRNGTPLLMIAPRVMSVPPLNSKNPRLLVRNKRSASISPALNTLVPRRKSRLALLDALVTSKVPPPTTMRLLPELAPSPRNKLVLAKTVAPLDTIN